MTQKIRGKVAKILTDRLLAVNVGSADGVKVGMFFDVHDRNTKQIIDPDTKETLGILERVKVRVQVIKSHEKFSLASTFHKTKINKGGSFEVGPFSSFLMPAKWVTEYETLSGKDEGWNEISESDSYVKEGDPVIQVLDCEKDPKEGLTSRLRLLEAPKDD